MLASAAIALGALLATNAVLRGAPVGAELSGSIALEPAWGRALAVAMGLVVVVYVARLARRLRPLSPRLGPTALLLLAMMPLLQRTFSEASAAPILCAAAVALLGELALRQGSSLAGPGSSLAAAALLALVFGALAPVTCSMVAAACAAVAANLVNTPAFVSPLGSATRLFERPVRPWLDGAPLAALYAELWGDYGMRWLFDASHESERVREQTIDYLARVNRLATLPTALLLAGLAAASGAAIRPRASAGSRRPSCARTRTLLAISALAPLIVYGFVADAALAPLMLHVAPPLALLAADLLETLALRSRTAHGAAIALLVGVLAHSVPVLVARG